MNFRVSQIDHVELLVPDRFQAADWYQKVLGLEIIEDFRFWAEDSSGPLMIGSKEAGTKLALFTGQPIGSVRGTGFHLTAFRVDGEGFFEFLSRLEQLKTEGTKILSSDGKHVTSRDVKDHQKAFSIYFCDPWGHQFEITTYDYLWVSERM